MKLIKPSYEILTNIDGRGILQRIEMAGRTCYKSENPITTDSSRNFIRMLIDRGHTSVLEHESISVRIICDRGVSHELVRHRIASFSQESTRYCNYSKDKFGKQLTFIIPPWIRDLKDPDFLQWKKILSRLEDNYLYFLAIGWSPQQARSVLPNALKTEIVITANLREWRLIFKQRTSPKAHPQMQEIMTPLRLELQKYLPEVFQYL